LSASQADRSACLRQSAFDPLIEAAMTKAIRRVLLDGLPPAKSGSDVSPELIATACSWAIAGAIKQWISTPGRAPADQMVPIILKLVAPILQQAGPPPGVGSLRGDPAGFPA
jgi:hypothetical protein